VILLNYRIVETEDYLKDKELLTDIATKRLAQILERLQNDPFPSEIEATSGVLNPIRSRFHDMYRFKFAGKFRLIYAVNIDSHKIYLIKVERRSSKTYKRI